MSPEQDATLPHIHEQVRSIQDRTVLQNRNQAWTNQLYIRQ